MRYLFAILMVIPGILTMVLEGDATLLLFYFMLSMYLIWSKTDWTKGPYKIEGDDKNGRNNNYVSKRF